MAGMTVAARKNWDFRSLRMPQAIEAAWKSLGERPVVVERAVELAMEISVMVARSPRGEMKAYPAAVNHHEQQILVWSAIPANIPAAMSAHAQELALSIAEQFKLEGLAGGGNVYHQGRRAAGE